MNKVGEWGAVLLGGVESQTGVAPVSPFLAQLWRRAGRRNPSTVDPDERAAFAFWYVRHYYGHFAFQWPLPPALAAWLNAPAADFTAQNPELPGLRGIRPSPDPKYLSRFMQHVAQTDGKKFRISGASGYFDFLAWYAFDFLPKRHMPPALLPAPLLRLLNYPADEDSLPLTTGMLWFDKVAHPERYRQLQQAAGARLHAICYEVMRDVLACGNPRLIPPFVSAFWRAAATDTATAFDYVTAAVEARSQGAPVELPPNLPLTRLLSDPAPPRNAPPAVEPQRPLDLAIISYRDRHTICGLGKAGAYAIESLRATGLPVTDLDYNLGRKELPRERSHNAAFPNNSRRNVHVFNLNAEHVLECAMCNVTRIRERDYFIAQFYWELSDICAIHEPALQAVDEVWAASEWLANVYRARTAKPVVNMGTVVTPPPPQKPYTRADFGLPAGPYLFLLNFDTSSIVERKNPLAAVQAFAAAFPKGSEKAGLVIKTRNVGQIGPRADREHWERTAAFIQKDPRIQVIDATVPDDAMAGLYTVTDCYVSLHRSEGFGYGPAEALYWAKPVIVTNFSSVCDFCNESTARLVDYELISVKSGEYPYVECEGTHFWAQPNIATAARHMRQLYENPAAGAALGRQGQQLIQERYSPQALSRRYLARFEELGFISPSKDLA